MFSCLCCLSPLVTARQAHACVPAILCLIVFAAVAVAVRCEAASAWPGSSSSFASASSAFISLLSTQVANDVSDSASYHISWIPMLNERTAKSGFSASHADGDSQSDDELITVDIGLRCDESKQHAKDLLFKLISHPHNTRSNEFAGSTSTESVASRNGTAIMLDISTAHQRAIQLGVLSPATAFEDLHVMNSFPRLFPRFVGEHLTQAESDYLMSPSVERIHAVEQWLQLAGISLSNKRNNIVNNNQPDCPFISSSRDFYHCRLTSHKYLQLFPFADIRLYRHMQHKDTVITKVFPDDLHSMLKAAAAAEAIYNETGRSLLRRLISVNAIHFIGGANNWPQAKPDILSNRKLLWHTTTQHESIPMDKLAALSKTISKASALTSEQSLSIDFSGNSSSLLSADDANLVLLTVDIYLQVYADVYCPNASDQRFINRAANTLQCVPQNFTSFGNWTLTHFTAIILYEEMDEASGLKSIVELSFTPGWGYEESGALFFWFPLPYYYIQYQFKVTFYFSNSLTGEVVSKNMTSNRAVTAQPYMQLNSLKNWYHWPQNLTNPGSSVTKLTQSVASFQVNNVGSGYWSPADLSDFLQFSGGYTAEEAEMLAAEAVLHGNGTNNPNDPYTETSLDTQWMIGIAPNISTTVYHFNWNSNGLGALLSSVLSTADEQLPTVLSISYGSPEITAARSYGVSELEFMEGQLQQLANRGISIFACSADFGSHLRYWNVESQPQQFQCSWPLAVSWPASSKFVTAVGATQQAARRIIRHSNGNVSYCPIEVAASAARGSWMTSGGGFSSYFSMPEYQQNAVANYLHSCPQPPSSLFNASNRAVPDISVFGREFQIFHSGSSKWIDGTSDSTPTMAAFISNINQHRKLHGLAPLGFLNYRLYDLARSHPDAFNDITVGDNGCAGIDSTTAKTYCCPTGFQTCAGYDAVTGIGSPKWDVLAPLLIPEVSLEVTSQIFKYSPYAIPNGCSAADFQPTPAINSNSTINTTTATTAYPSTSATAAPSTPMSTTLPTSPTRASTSTTHTTSSMESTLPPAQPSSATFALTFALNCTVYFNASSMFQSQLIAYISGSIRIDPIRIAVNGARCGSTIVIVTIGPPRSSPAASQYLCIDSFTALNDIATAVTAGSFLAPTLGSAQSLSIIRIVCANGQTASNNDVNQCESGTAANNPCTSRSRSSGRGFWEIKWHIVVIVIASAILALLLLGLCVYVERQKDAGKCSCSKWCNTSRTCCRCLSKSNFHIDEGDGSIRIGTRIEPVEMAAWERITKKFATSTEMQQSHLLRQDIDRIEND